ncbi:Nicotinate-nucleotide pyrophosphorylase [carboxylating] [Stieleria bergensis]|uniref:nicotinate-nucleotide diphosphorylase (carboxylating) n=1 Tax=Stieleria bergensis TaxID=2528025 RepID=A0A517STV6_9BACT|nr:Nicotinate-nucleotide pyrophosphorylase [carboxylating] [Planctomycetes bacterium SV_7m_r]
MLDYSTVTADADLENDLRALVRLSIAEDLADQVDWTSVCLIDATTTGSCDVVPRQAGICAGLVTLPWIIEEFDADIRVQCFGNDGAMMPAGQPLARLTGNARDLLTCERTVLNIISRLCGVATGVRRYVEKVAEYKANVYDTRKTTPGWRLLEKYAVQCGGAKNHRRGLYDGFLIKDNHLQLGGTSGQARLASEAARQALAWSDCEIERMHAPTLVEIEVDTLAQLRDVLPTGPHIVLIDNFSLEEMRQAVALRDELNPRVELEASGTVTIDTIADIAATGVDRISSGALTHQATWLDLGLDWADQTAS